MEGVGPGVGVSGVGPGGGVEAGVKSGHDEGLTWNEGVAHVQPLHSKLGEVLLRLFEIVVAFEYQCVEFLYVFWDRLCAKKDEI